MHILMSSQSFEIFYGEGYGDIFIEVLNAFRLCWCKFECEYFEDRAVLTTKCSRAKWHKLVGTLLTRVHDSLEDNEEDEE